MHRFTCTRRILAHAHPCFTHCFTRGQGSRRVCRGLVTPQAILAQLPERAGERKAGEHAEGDAGLRGQGPGRAQQMLEAIIAEAIEAGTLRACDPQEAADELAGLWLGMTSLAIKLGARPPLSDDEIKQRVERALDVFLRAYSLA